MAVQEARIEREALDAKARAILDECPDVFRLIARGAAIDPEHEALVYLRTALDPAPVVTTARSFLGLLSAAGRWLSENGVGPGDAVSILAPHCTAVSVAYWSAMSFATVHPLNLLFSREAIVAQLAAAKTKILFTPPPGAPRRTVRESRGRRPFGSDARADRDPSARWPGCVRRREARARFRLARAFAGGGFARSRRRHVADGRHDRRAEGGSLDQPQRDGFGGRDNARDRHPARRSLPGRASPVSCRRSVLRRAPDPCRRRDADHPDRGEPAEP